MIDSGNITILIGGKHKVKLGQSTYLASGGEGTVHQHGGLAIKIYHDPAKMIPIGKINELKLLDLPEILGPRDIVYTADGQTAVGFVMPYVKDTEFLCRLFSKSFKEQNFVTPDKTISLVKNMRGTLLEIHKREAIAADYNEMNFLVNDRFNTVYHIDVDSYQTKNYPATAIMDSVRDRKVPFGTFNQSTDWFSWAVVTFQLYTGIHPYKGRHPSYKGSDFNGRMEANISVLNPDVSVPKAFSDWSIIPKAHLDWYTQVFEKGERSIPPNADGSGAVRGFAAVTVVSGTGLDIEVYLILPKAPMAVQYIDGCLWSIDEDGVRKDGKVVLAHPMPAFKGAPGFIHIQGEDPVMAYIVESNGTKELRFFQMDGNLIQSVAADGFMLADGKAYSSFNGSLNLHRLEKLARLKVLTRKIGTISGTSKVFPGVVMQDVFGKRLAAIPHGEICVNVALPDLQGTRIVSAKASGKILEVVCSQKGTYNRHIYEIDLEASTIKGMRKEDDVDQKETTVVMKSSGVCAAIKNGDTLELFASPHKASKEIVDSQIQATMPIIDAGSNTLVVNGSQVLKISMRK
jgi:hypothetical protein